MSAVHFHNMVFIYTDNISTFFAHTTEQIQVLKFVLKIKTFMFSISMNSSIKHVMKCRWTEQSTQYVIWKYVKCWSGQYIILYGEW